MLSAKRRKINQAIVYLPVTIVSSTAKRMAPESSAATNTQSLCRKDSARTQPGHGVLDKKTRVGIGRGTLELVPDWKWWQAARNGDAVRSRGISVSKCIWDWRDAKGLLLRQGAE